MAANVPIICVRWGFNHYRIFVKLNFNNMKDDNLKNEHHTDANNVLPAGVSQVDVNAKWECCKCGWIGKHSESADKAPVVNDAWILACPKCGNKEFYACR